MEKHPVLATDGATLIGMLELEERYSDFLKKGKLEIIGIVNTTTDKLMGYILQGIPIEASVEEVNSYVIQASDIRPYGGWNIPKLFEVQPGDQIVLRRAVTS